MFIKGNSCTENGTTKVTFKWQWCANAYENIMQTLARIRSTTDLISKMNVVIHTVPSLCPEGHKWDNMKSTIPYYSYHTWMSWNGRIFPQQFRGHSMRYISNEHDVSSLQQDARWITEWAKPVVNINSTHCKVVLVSFNELSQCASHWQWQCSHVTDFLPVGCSRRAVGFLVSI